MNTLGTELLDYVHRHAASRELRGRKADRPSETPHRRGRAGENDRSAPESSMSATASCEQTNALRPLTANASSNSSPFASMRPCQEATLAWLTITSTGPPFRRSRNCCSIPVLYPDRRHRSNHYTPGGARITPLVWEENDRVHVTYDDPSSVAGRHSIERQSERLETVSEVRRELAPGESSAERVAVLERSPARSQNQPSTSR